MIGIYNPWNGSGSVLEIELEKDLVFTTDMIRDIQIEGVKPDFEWTVDNTYGLIGSCWKAPKSIEDAPAQQKGLDDVIKTCEEMSKKQDNLKIQPELVQMPGTEGNWGEKHWGNER
jgi:hypothetical protein